MAYKTWTWCLACSEEIISGAYCVACGDPNDIEFVVNRAGGRSETFGSFRAATAGAVDCALVRGEATIDVVCSSRAAAHAYGCLEDYDEDPEASVMKRLVVKVEDQGRVA